MLTHDDLEEATGIVRAHVPVTPAYRWPLLDRVTGTRSWVKHEKATPTGAFKVRGGLVFVDRVAPIPTHSARPGVGDSR